MKFNSKFEELEVVTYAGVQILDESKETRLK